MKSLLKSGLVLLLLQTAGVHATTTVTNIAAGFFHSLFLKSDGSLWAMGRNDSGQLGDGTFNGTNRPEQIVSSDIIAVAGGGYGYSDGGPFISEGHTLFIKSDGSLWAMGYNSPGQLGDGTFNTTNKPEQIVSSGVVAIAAGEIHSLFLKSDGSLWAMGLNNYGQLGDGKYYIKTNQPEQIVSNGVTAITGGGFHSLFLKSDGSLWAMGNHQFGQLGDGTAGTSYPYGTNRPEQIVSNGVVAIAGGYAHSLFLKSDGSLWGMGANGYDQLGDGTFNDANRPEEIVSSGVVAIAGGGGHSLFLKSDGSLWAMGYNAYGPLGDGFTNRTSSLPEQIVPSPQPLLTVNTSSNTNLQFTATCQFGGTFYLLTSTNLMQPLSQWTPVRTNSVKARGTNNFNVTLTNAVSLSIGQQFYILQSQ